MVPIPISPVARLLAARGLRALGDGCISLVLPLHLTTLGFTPFEIGAIATATLLGSGVLTLLVGMHARRLGARTLLLAACATMALTGIAFALGSSFWPLMLVAVVGTLNPSSGDVSVFLPLEHALLSQLASDRERTAIFARYSLTGALCGAVGALGAGALPALSERLHIAWPSVLQAAFWVYAVLGLASAALYRGLPRAQTSEATTTTSALTQSRRRVIVLAALFSLDAFAGGFLVQSLLALWLFERFAVSPAFAGTLFFWTGVLSALSYLVAARLARRIGLLFTMVFTHLASSLLLLGAATLNDLYWVMGLLLARSALSQMDVPTRTSYVMAVVLPSERAAAASFTAVPRSLAAASSPLIAGYLLGLSTFGWPLVVAGTLKIVYDLLMLVAFRTVKPPEEVSG